MAPPVACTALDCSGGPMLQRADGDSSESPLSRFGCLIFECQRTRPDSACLLGGGVTRAQEMMEVTRPFYQALEKLGYGLPDADFDILNNAQTWPAKIDMTVNVVTTMLEKDEEKYETEQQEAQESFELHLNDLTNQISTLQQHVDLNQVSGGGAGALRRWWRGKRITQHA